MVVVVVAVVVGGGEGQELILGSVCEAYERLTLENIVQGEYDLLGLRS